jgi:ATP-binding cassette, subfamily C, bacterial CydC
MWSDLARVLSLWQARRAWLLAGAGIAVFAVLAGLALLALAGQGVAAALAGGSLAALFWLRPLVVLRPALRWAERMVTHAATFRALADTRVWFFRRLAERLPAGLGLNRAGDLLGRMVTDVEALDGLYLRALVPAAAALVAVLAVAVVLGAAPSLALVLCLPLLLALLLPLLLAPAAARASTALAEAQGNLRAAVVDPLSGLEDTLAANAEARALAAVEEAGATLAHTQHALAWRTALAGAMGGLLAQAALLGALAWGLAQGTGHGEVALAVTALFLALAAAEPLGAMPRAGAALAAAAAGARRLFQAADAAPPVPEPQGPAPQPEGFALSLKGISFRWSEDRPWVFQGLDLDVPEGQRLAILGPSGIGKSSLAALLLKLAQPQEGRISLGGADLAALPAAEARHRIACLTQRAWLFDDSIAANLRLAAPGAPDAALWRALDRAGIGDLVRALPEELETQCGEGGARFSGGQARRIALARVLLSPAPILILDEPTAGLDAETERAFLATLEQVAEGRTVILITHRLTGVEQPHRVLRLAGGRLLPAAG